MGTNDIWTAHCQEKMSCGGAFYRQETECLGRVAVKKSTLKVQYRKKYIWGHVAVNLNAFQRRPTCGVCQAA